MIKKSWGTKRTCPKCGTRFYDLGKEDPVVCIECENLVSGSLGLVSARAELFASGGVLDSGQQEKCKKQ